MKSIILLLTALSMICSAAAQSLEISELNMLTPRQQEEAAGYLHQARTAQISGWGLCFSGAVLATIGSFMVIGSEKQNSNNSYYENWDQTGTILVFAGAATAGFGIRLFRKAHCNRDIVSYMVRENRKAFIAPGYSPATRTAGLRITIPVGK